MRRKIAVICGADLLAVVLLGGCSSVASGTVRTTAAVEVSQETKTAEPAENSDTTQESVDSKTGGEKPHVVLQQNETESSEAETGSADPYADLLKDPEVMAANKIYVKETAETGKTRIVFAGDILFDSHYAIMASLLKRGQGIRIRRAERPRRERNLRSVRIRSTRPGSLTWERISCPWRTTTPMITAKCP